MLVLDVGADDVCDEDGTGWPSSNPLERRWPWPERLTAVGLSDGSRFRRQHPGVTWVQASGLALPFPDAAFDLVVSNAVIEHVGGEEAQRAFAGELCRVGRRVVIMTPNRWFPIEVHTLLPLVHWAPEPLSTSLLARLSPSRGVDLHLLGPRALADLIPDSHEVASLTGGMIATVVAERRAAPASG